MSIRTIVIIGAATLCGGSAAVGVLQVQSSRTAQAQAEVEVTKVLVADQAISRGQVLRADLVRQESWPRHLLPEGTISELSEIEDRAVLGPMVAGEPILQAKLASKEAGRGLAALIPPGFRACTIQASGVTSNLAGFVRPGNRVDVLLHLRTAASDDSGGASTTTLLQAVEILAVGKLLEGDSSATALDAKEASSVTLLVTPEQAILLNLGQHMGDLTLALRNSEDVKPAENFLRTADDIKYRKEQEEALLAEVTGSPRRSPPRVHQIRTLRGGQWGQMQVAPTR